MTLTRTANLLARIPDAATRWPEWFWPHCPVCGDPCDHSRTETGTPVLICLACRHDVPAPEYRFDPLTEGDDPRTLWGGTFEDPRNLHLLIEVARAVGQVITIHVGRGEAMADIDGERGRDSVHLALLTAMERRLEVPAQPEAPAQ